MAIFKKLRDKCWWRCGENLLSDLKKQIKNNVVIGWVIPLITFRLQANSLRNEKNLS